MPDMVMPDIVTGRDSPTVAAADRGLRGLEVVDQLRCLPEREVIELRADDLAALVIDIGIGPLSDGEDRPALPSTSRFIVRLDGSVKMTGSIFIMEHREPSRSATYFFTSPNCHNKNAHSSAVCSCRCFLVEPIPWPAS